jgi:6-phosphogluconolactonase
MTEREPDLRPMPNRFAGTDAADLARPNHGEPELVVAASPDEAAATAAERIANALIAAVDSRGRADFCTTGGSTPVPIYRLLSSSPLCDTIPWSQVHVWWGDDRFVPRGDPESNVTSVDDVLVGGGGSSGGGAYDRPGRGGAPIPAANIHPFPVDLALAQLHDNGWCAARYAEEMAASLPVTVGNWPVFDLILVGVGPDGHVLSCFPHSAALRSMAWTMGIPAPTHVGPHVARMTINPRLLEASPVMAVTWGSEKAAALGHVFGDVRDEGLWPVQRTRRTGAVWIVDVAAAAALPGR